MLTVEQAVEDIVLNNGMYAIPLTSFFCDWDKLNRMFINTLKKFEKYRPRLTQKVMYLDKYGVALPDALAVKSIAFYNMNMIPSQCEPCSSDEYDFDAYSKILKSIGASEYLVHYLANYSTAKYDVTEDTFTTLDGENAVTLKLQAMPDITTMIITKGSNSYKLTSRTDAFCTFTDENNTGNTARLTYGNLKLVFKLTDTDAEDINVSYTSKYEAVTDLQIGDEAFQTFFGADLLTSIGNIKAVTKFESLPADFTADGLIEVGKSLKEKVEQMKDDRSLFYEYLPT